MNKKELKLFKRYKKIDYLLQQKEYDKVIKKLTPFIESNIAYINSCLSRPSNVTKKMDTFLKRCGKNSVYCIKEFYCRKNRSEIKSDIIYCIFILMTRYKFQNRHFIAYLLNSFYYEYSRYIFRQLKEITDHDGFKAYYDNIDSNLYDYRDSMDYKLDEICGYESFNSLTFKWINESFDSKEDSLFAFLNKEEKEIILLYFQEKLSDDEISEIMNYHRNSVNQKKLRAIKKIEQEFNIKYSRTRRIKRI